MPLGILIAKWLLQDAKQAEESEETRNVASGIDLDVDGEIEVMESEEKKQSHKVRR